MIDLKNVRVVVKDNQLVIYKEQALIVTLEGYWILEYDYWDDNGIWIDWRAEQEFNNE